jgi:hypothetical protein
MDALVRVHVRERSKSIARQIFSYKLSTPYILIALHQRLSLLRYQVHGHSYKAARLTSFISKRAVISTPSTSAADGATRFVADYWMPRRRSQIPHRFTLFRRQRDHYPVIGWAAMTLLFLITRHYHTWRRQ